MADPPDHLIDCLAVDLSIPAEEDLGCFNPSPCGGSRNAPEAGTHRTAGY